MERLKLITPKMPKGIELPPLDFKPPTAGIPSYKPIVIPPSDLEAPEDVEEETSEEVVAQPSLKIPVIDIQMPVPEPAVVVTAVTTAVVAVATTSVTSSLFEPIKKKVFFGKLKDAAEDQEHQIQILGTFVRLGVVIWSGFIITLNYVEIPMIRKSPGGDITFPASIFTGALATFGLTTGNGNGNKKDKPTTK